VTTLGFARWSCVAWSRRRRPLTSGQPTHLTGAGRWHQLYRRGGLWRSRRAHWPVHRRPPSRVFPGLQVRCPLDVSRSRRASARDTAPRYPTPDYSRQHIIDAVNQACGVCRPTTWTCSSFTSARQGRCWTRGAIQTLQDLKQVGKIRFLGVSSDSAEPHRPHPDGRVRRLPIPYSACTRA